MLVYQRVYVANIIGWKTTKCCFEELTNNHVLDPTVGPSRCWVYPECKLVMGLCFHYSPAMVGFWRCFLSVFTGILSARFALARDNLQTGSHIHVWLVLWNMNFIFNN